MSANEKRPRSSPQFVTTTDETDRTIRAIRKYLTSRM